MQQNKLLNILLLELQETVWASSADAPREPIVEWAQTNIDMSYDTTAHRSGLLKLYPYQVEPLRESENPEVEEIDLMFAQRLGKSQLWKISALKQINDGRLSGMVLYPSEKEATDTNRDTVLPLLKTLKKVKRDLQSRGNVKKDSWHLPSCRSILYYSGSSPAISKTLNWGAIDEADFCQVAKSGDEGKNTGNITALKIRMKTHNPRLEWVVSSPTLKGGPINDRFTKGSRAVWNLRCLKCRKLSPGNQLAFPQPDGSYRGLQWDKDEQGNVIEDSIRWICPACGHAHTYADAPKMNENPEQYVHANPKRTKQKSYQAGALANPALWTWLEIAEAQENADTVEGQKYLRNTILGMPFTPKARNADGEELLQVITSKKGDYPKDLPQQISVVVLGADQQMSGLGGAKYYKWTVRGWCENGDSYLLDCGLANTLAELKAAGNATYYGHRPLIRVLDQGGFDNAQDTDPFIRNTPGWIYYKGEDDRTLKGAMWKWSQDDPHSKLALANAIEYQVKLLDAIYGPARPKGYRWNLPDNVDKEYFAEVSSIQPNYRKKDPEAFGAWDPVKGQRRDYFDAEKMAMVGLDIAARTISAHHWHRKNIPLFLRLEIIAEIKRNRKK